MTERRYAVLIASSRYPHAANLLEPLRCPTNDVDGLGALLVSEDYGRFEQPVILKDLPHNEVLRHVNRVLGHAREDDLVLIYYSGHGKLNRAGRLHLTTVDTEIDLLDTTAISVERIRELIDISRSRKVVLILDCCYSGRVRDAFLKSGVDDQLQRVHADSGIYILTASTGVQVAHEKEGERFSYFTKHLLDGIREGKADRDDSGLVSVSGLYEYAVSQMRNYQSPMMWGLNVRGAEPVIARTGAHWKEKQRALIRRQLVGTEVRRWPEARAAPTPPAGWWGGRGEYEMFFEEVKAGFVEEKAAALDGESRAALARGDWAAALDRIQTWLTLRPAHRPALERRALAERQRALAAEATPRETGGAAAPRRPPAWAARLFGPQRRRYVYPALLAAAAATLLAVLVAQPLYGTLLSYGTFSAALSFARPKQGRRLALWLSAPVLLLFGFFVGLSAPFEGYFTGVLVTQDVPLLALALLCVYGGAYAGARLAALRDEARGVAGE